MKWLNWIARRHYSEMASWQAYFSSFLLCSTIIFSWPKCFHNLHPGSRTSPILSTHLKMPSPINGSWCFLFLVLMLPRCFELHLTIQKKSKLNSRFYPSRMNFLTTACTQGWNPESFSRNKIDFFLKLQMCIQPAKRSPIMLRKIFVNKRGTFPSNPTVNLARIKSRCEHETNFSMSRLLQLSHRQNNSRLLVRLVLCCSTRWTFLAVS